MAGFDGLKSWWSKNPTLSCAVSSLAFIAFLFVFPFGLAVDWIGVAIGAVFGWVPGAVRWFSDGLLSHPKPVFAVLGFLLVFFMCLSSKDKKNEDKTTWKDRCATVSFVVLLICVMTFVFGNILEASSADVSSRILKLEERVQLARRFDVSSRQCLSGEGFVSTPLRGSVPAHGPALLMCENDGRARRRAPGHAVERALSQVDLTELSCDRGDCSLSPWTVTYVPASQAIVFEAKPQAMSRCQRMVKSMRVSWAKDLMDGLSINGRPGDESGCRSGMNTVKLEYSPSWLDEPAKP